MLFTHLSHMSIHREKDQAVSHGMGLMTPPQQMAQTKRELMIWCLSVSEDLCYRINQASAAQTHESKSSTVPSWNCAGHQAGSAHVQHNHQRLQPQRAAGECAAGVRAHARRRRAAHRHHLHRAHLRLWQDWQGALVAAFTPLFGCLAACATAAECTSIEPVVCICNGCSSS